MRVAVAGAGIAGLTAAIALADRGFCVDLFERAASFEDIGAGIQLSPNATSVLDRLGVMADIVGRIVEPAAIEIRGGRHGALLTRIPLGATARRRYGAPFCLISRGDLHAGLMAAAGRRPAIRLATCAKLDGVRAAQDGVAFFAAGREHGAEALIAADGIGSGLRTGHFGHAGAIPTGRMAWRATIAVQDAPPGIDSSVTGVWMGPGAHLVHYPVAAGAKLNIVVIGGGANDAPDREGFPPGARGLLETPLSWTRWPLLRLDLSPAWARGRAVLIGDAAHAMAPSAAQGGAQAIEDGWVVAGSLAARSSDPGAAFCRYEALRRDRVMRVAREAERNLSVFELRGIAALGRNLAIAAVSPGRHLSRRDWLYGWRPQPIA